MTDHRPDIEAVFEYYERRVLSSSSKWQKAECPLLKHEDRNPSASVNTESGKWQCFSCGEHGDAFDIIKENEGLAGFTEIVSFAKEHFAGSSDHLRVGSRPRGGVPTRSRNNRGGGSFVPPWRRGI